MKNSKPKMIHFSDDELSFISKKIYESTCKGLGMEPYSTSINMDELTLPIEGGWGYFSDLSEE